MIQLILIVAGIYILIKGRINFSTERALVRPKSVYVGIALIIDGILISYINFYAYGVLILIMILAYFLSQKAETGILPDNPTDKRRKIVLVVIGIILLITFLVVFFYMLNSGLNGLRLPSAMNLNPPLIATPPSPTNNQTANSSGLTNSNGLFNNVSDDIAMLNAASSIAKQWTSDAQTDVVIMISGNRLTNSHIIYFSSKNKPGTIYHVGLDYNNQNVAGSNGEESNVNVQQKFGNIGYIGVNNIKISSVTAFQMAEDYAKSKLKNPLTDYDNIFLLAYGKEFNANVWLYSLTNKTNASDIFRVEIDASSGNIVGASQ